MHNPGARSHEIIDDIEIFRPRYLPERWEILQRDRGGIPSAWRANPVSRLSLLPFLLIHAIATAKLAGDCDLIHAHWSLSGMAAWLSKPLHKKPYIVSVHGSDIFQGSNLPYIRQPTRAALNDASRVIAVSRELANAVIHLGINPGKVVTIPDGVDTNLFHPADNSRRRSLFFAGTLSQNKGVDILLRAFAEILPTFPEYCLELAGDGPEYNQLLNLTKDLRIDNRVFFLGSLSQDQVAKRMREALAFILPSRSEGLGVVLLEALASGTPCIGSEVGGIPDILTPDVGILVPPEDAIALANAIRKLIEDPINYLQKSHQSRKRAETVFSWSIIGPQISDLYETSIGGIG